MGFKIKEIQVKPPTIKLNQYYSLKYVQEPSTERFYYILCVNKFIFKLPYIDSEALYYFVRGIEQDMDTLEKIDLWKRFRKFENRVIAKDKFLNKIK